MAVGLAFLKKEDDDGLGIIGFWVVVSLGSLLMF
jgi:hypothetical protein